mgnify:CR=1 FL=1
MVYLVLSNRRWESQKIFPKTRGSAWFCIEQYFSCFNIRIFYFNIAIQHKQFKLMQLNYRRNDEYADATNKKQKPNICKENKIIRLFWQAPHYMVYATGSIFHDEWLDNMFIVLASEYNKRNKTTSGSKRSHWNM